MRATVKRFLFLLLAAAIVLSAASCTPPDDTQPKGLLPEDMQKHVYHLDVSLNEADKTLSGQLRVSYTNPTGKELVSIPFMVYPNAFLQEDTAPFDDEFMRMAYPNRFSPGGITLSRVAADGVDTTYELANEDSTLLWVDLPTALAAEGKADIDFEFSVQLPNSLGRFGYGDRTYNLCNFYPIACAYDGTDFYTYPYYSRGDPFVSDMADYEVTLSVPTGMVVAHSGTATVAEGAERTIYNIKANDVRDFAAVCSRYFVVSEKTVVEGDTETTVYAYTLEDSFGEEESLNAGVQAVEAFSSMVGPYPYPALRIVETDFFIGGMEYPNIVLIDQSLYDASIADMLEYVVVHEVGHQWFYGVVGNDEVAEPWLDETLTEYLTLCYYGYTYGKEAQQAQYDENVAFIYMFSDMYGLIPEGQDRVGMPITDYDNDYAYSAVVYSRGTMMMDALAEEIGQDTLFDALSVYYWTYAGKRATKQDLLRVLDEETGFDCTSFMDEWL